MRSRFDIIRYAHDRRCDRCEKLFLASIDDQRKSIYKCLECRVKPAQEMEPFGQGTRNKTLVRQSNFKSSQR